MADQAPSGLQGSLGSLLRRYREAAGLSQEALAERAGISPRGLLYLERGVHRPYPATLHRLADALSLTDQEREALAQALWRRGQDRDVLLSAEEATPVATLDGIQAARQGAGLPSDRLHNLPASLSSFIGREHAQAAVQELLAAHRLVTLIGTGGVGKTRLALAVAESLLGDFPDGVWLVELAALSPADPGLVLETVAQSLRLRMEAGRSAIETLHNHCRGKQMLLVLDNCEHLLPACAALVSALLRGAPELRILATSREPLRVTGEQSYRVPSLSAPDPRRLPAVELAGVYEAVRLFVQRAQEQRPEFALTERNARAVAEICARLDGIPLAIELAAARVGSMSLDAIVARLDDRFRLLTGGARDALLRQQTLRATLDWSYDLLTGPEQILLHRLAVFAGGWTPDAASAVCTGAEIEASHVPDLLASLTLKSLVQIQETSGEMRYVLLETIRQYAAAHLTIRGEVSTVRDRHLAWCVALAEQAEPELTGSGHEAWLSRLEIEHDNVRAALAWARERGAVEAGLRLAGALRRFWTIRDHFTEGRQWLEWALATGEGPPAVRARALNAAGELAAEQGDFGREVILQEEALALWRSLGDRAGIASSLNRLAWVASLLGDLDRAVALEEESLALQRDLDDPWGIRHSLSHLGWVASLQGHYARAVALVEESLVLSRALGDRWFGSLSLSQLGLVAGWQGDFARALALLEEALVINRELGYRTGIATTLNRLAWVTARLGDYDLAAAQLEECLALQRELGDRRGMARSLCHLGAVIGRQGDRGRAQTLLVESLRLSRDVGAQDLLAEGLEAVAYVTVAQRQARQAARLGGAAAAAREKLGMPLPPALRAEHDQVIDAIRSALGEAAFAAAWADGRSMTLTEAMPLALNANATD